MRPLPASSLPPPSVGRVVRVLPDEPGINKTFDYLLPDRLVGAASVRLGSIVRFPLHGRQLRGWITGLDVTSSAEFGRLKEITKVTGFGPPREVLALSRWAAHRWWGRPASLLRTASPSRAVSAFAPVRPIGLGLLPIATDGDEVATVARRALAHGGPCILRLPPAADTFGVLVEAIRYAGERGILVLAPSLAEAATIARRLRRLGVRNALLPDDWARAATGSCVVVGARSAAWAPIAQPGAIVVLDEHDDVYVQEQMPTWNARDVAIERGSRLDVPVLLVSAVPSVGSSSTHPLFTPSRSYERSRWPLVEVIDRSEAEPGRQGLLSERVASILRSDDVVVCILNRKGRASLCVCVGCTSPARCEACDGALALDESENGDREFRCQRCHLRRPVLCAACGRAAFKNVRMGVTRAREEIQALALRPVCELTGDTIDTAEGAGGLSRDENARVFIGTEAALHRVPSADTVVFLEIDSELFAPRYRAGEQTLGLLARAARLVSPTIRDGQRQGKILVQTRVPDHEVIRAIVLGDPSRFTDNELVRRRALRLPPAVALAEVSGPGSGTFAVALRETPENLEKTIEVAGPANGPFLVRAPSPEVLATALARCERPSERVRVSVDPPRV